MVFLAIFIDFLTAGLYFLQLNLQSSGIFFIGLLLHILLTLVLLLLVIRYNKRRYTRGYEGYNYLSIRYGIIVLSFLINGIVLFLYILNFFGINPIIFSEF